jgi:NAD(P)-dependent dehydrogenase (short-subunit alcohol dehydrogenase family)
VTIPEGLGVVITGGAGDIGRAMAAELVRRRARVTLIDQKPSEQVADVLATLGDVRYLSVDVRDHQAVADALANIDPLDVAIGNAGIVASAPFLEITAEQWRSQLDVNLSGCFNLGQAAACLMVSRKRPGRIIFTSSWVQDVPWPEICAYAVSKAGVKMLTRSMAAELAPHRILVNAIAPGIVEAGMARHQLETEPQYASRATRAVPLGRFQQPAEVARLISVLCSDAGDFMTGTILLSDGGCSLQTIIPEDSGS